MDINIDGLVTWLKDWFYDKTESDTLLGAKLDKSKSISSNANLDTYINTGFYYCLSNTTAQTISPLPESGRAFWLLVEDWGTSKYTKQTLTHYLDGGFTYVRIRNGGNWQPWKKIKDETDTPQRYSTEITHTCTVINDYTWLDEKYYFNGWSEWDVYGDIKFSDTKKRFEIHKYNDTGLKNFIGIGVSGDSGALTCWWGTSSSSESTYSFKDNNDNYIIPSLDTWYSFRLSRRGKYIIFEFDNRYIHSVEASYFTGFERITPRLFSYKTGGTISCRGVTVQPKQSSMDNLIMCRDIPSDADLNRYIHQSNGYYRCNTSAIAQSLTNCPTQWAFNMVVYQMGETTGGTAPVRQEIRPYRVNSTDQVIYARNYFNGNWEKWSIYAPVKSEYVVGTHGTTATATWTGTCSQLSKIENGTTIFFYLTSAGASNVTLNLTLADGTTTGAKNVYFKGTTRLSTQYPINSIVTLVYTTKIDNGAWYVASANDNNSYNANEYGGVQTKCGGTITSGALAGAKASDKKYYTLSSGLVLDTSYPIVQYNANKTTSDTNTNQLYNKRYDCLITTTKSMTLTAPNPVYIEGTSYKDGKFTVSSNVLTQTLTNGRFYWLIGFAYDSTHIRFGQYEKIWYYDGTNLAPVVETIDSTYYRYSLSSSKYDVDINDGSYIITAKVVDSQGNPVSGRTLVLLENGNTMVDTNLDDASTKTTNNNGIATWEIPIGKYSYNADPVLKWGLFNYNIQNTDVNCQVYIDGWYYLSGSSSSTYALMRNKNYAKLVFNGWHPSSDVTTSWVQLGSSGMALDALPYTYFEAIGFVNTTIFYIRVKPSVDANGNSINGAGNIEIRCGSSTISKNNDFYLDTMWAIKE